MPSTTPMAPSEIAINTTGTINSNDVTYRAVPSVQGNAPVGQLNTGHKVTIVGKITTSGNPAEWYKVNLPDGLYWIAAEYVTVDTAPTIPNSQGNGAGEEMRLDIPWFSQIENGSGHNACGETAVKMILSYHGKATPSLKEMADHIHKWGIDTSAYDLKELAQFYGNITLSPTLLQGSIDALHTPLQQNRPAIILVNYHALQFHNPIEDRPVGHWPVVVGYNSAGYYLNDPLWLPANNHGKGGKDLFIARDILANAMGVVNRNFLALY